MSKTLGDQDPAPSARRVELPVKVLQVIDTLSMGGAETWLMELLRHWSGGGKVQMDFLLTSGNRGIFDDEALRLGAKLFYLKYGRGTLSSFIPGFRRILRDGNYDGIHDHQDYTAGWHFLIAGSRLPRTRIVHVHNPSYGIRHTYGVTATRRSVATIGKHFVGRYATQLTGTSRQLLTEYGFDTPAFHRLPKTALYCGFDPRRFVGDTRVTKATLCREFGWPECSKIVLFAGRMDESPDYGHSRNHKNSGFAVDVVASCMKRDPTVRAIFAGKTSQALCILQRRIAEAGLTSSFAFTGVRTDVDRLMLGSDVLLFPSRGEGLGMVAVEAQAAGLHVLASTAVPRECVVVPELIQFLDASLGAEAWADVVLRLAVAPRAAPAANQLVAASPFAINNSAQHLSELYHTGPLPSVDSASLY